MTRGGEYLPRWIQSPPGTTHDRAREERRDRPMQGSRSLEGGRVALDNKRVQLQGLDSGQRQAVDPRRETEGPSGSIPARRRRTRRLPAQGRRSQSDPICSQYNRVGALVDHRSPVSLAYLRDLWMIDRMADLGLLVNSLRLAGKDRAPLVLERSEVRRGCSNRSISQVTGRVRGFREGRERGGDDALPFGTQDAEMALAVPKVNCQLSRSRVWR